MVYFVAEGNQDEARIFVECLTRASGGVLIHNQDQTYGGIDAGLLLGKKFDHISVTLTYDLKTGRFDILSPAFILNDVAAMLQLLENAYCKQNKYFVEAYSKQNTHLLGHTSAFDKIPEFANKAVTYLTVATCFFCDPGANPGGFLVTANQSLAGSNLAEEGQVHRLNKPAIQEEKQASSTPRSQTYTAKMRLVHEAWDPIDPKSQTYATMAMPVQQEKEEFHMEAEP